MTWTLSTAVAEFFYCIIGLIFIGTGFKALKDPTCEKRITTAASGLFWPLHLLRVPISPDGSPDYVSSLWRSSLHLKGLPPAAATFPRQPKHVQRQTG